MKEKIKKIAITIFSIWFAICFLLTIGIIYGNLRGMGWLGAIIFWTLIIGGVMWTVEISKSRKKF